MSYGSDANRQIAAHLNAAGRHIERGETVKAEQQLIAATQLSEAHGIPHFGRYTLTAIHARHAAHVNRETERRLKNREPIPPHATSAEESDHPGHVRRAPETARIGNEG